MRTGVGSRETREKQEERRRECAADQLISCLLVSRLS